MVETGSLVGYAHPAYATSLAEFGRPHELIQSSGWILERAVPGTDVRDAMGCYPIFACRDWSLMKIIGAPNKAGSVRI
jgi:hypothetical protein